MIFPKSFLLFCFLFTAILANGQKRKLSLGVVTEFQLESPTYDFYYGIQGKYDFTDRQGVQLQTGLSDASIGFVGADYIYNLFPFKGNPLIYIGGGAAYEYLTEGRGNEIVFSGQAGAQFSLGNFEPYIGFKSKFYFEAEAIDPSYINLGVRFRL